MKLIDIFVKYLPDNGGWPENATEAWQDYDRELCFHGSIRLNPPLRTAELSSKYREKGVYYRNMPGDFIVTREQYEVALHASKVPVWDGEGYPPAGVECEVITGGGKFSSCRVVFSDEKAGVAFVYLDNDDECSGRVDCVTGGSNRGFFRPIRTEADRKREEAIKAMRSSTTNFNLTTVVHAIDEVYDAIADGKIPGIKLED